MLGALLASSKKFLAFYQAERGKIGKEVHWAQDSSLPVGIDYRSTRLQTGMQVIRLRRVPAVASDAMKIAHELGHLLLDAEGFPATGAERQFETISSALNSMLHDPLVDSRLQIYGFDLWGEYQNELTETFRQLASSPAEPSGRVDRAHWAFNYAAKILDWELASHERGVSSNEFQSWFDSRYPAIAQEGQRLLALVREVGYDSPEKQTALFKEIIRRYRLDRLVFL